MLNLKRCKKCGIEISSSAKVCPRCGYKMKSGIYVILFIILAIIFCIVCFAVIK